MSFQSAISIRSGIAKWMVIAVISLILHIGFAVVAGNFGVAWGADGINYESPAVQLLYSGNLLDPSFLGNKTYWPPLWPIMLTLFYWVFGHDLFLVRILLSVMILVTSLFTYLLGRELFDETTGLLASVLVNVSPALFVNVVLHNYEIPIMFFLTPSLYFWMASHRASSLKKEYALLILGGIFLGLGTLTKAVLITLVPFAFGWEWIQEDKPKRLAIIRALVLTGAALLIILPWTGRNYLVHHEFILVNSNGDVNFEIGNNPWATGGFSWSPIMDEMRSSGGTALTRGWTFIREYPNRFWLVMRAKFDNFWAPQHLFIGANDIIAYELITEWGHGWLRPRLNALNLISNLLIGLGLAACTLTSWRLIRKSAVLVFVIFSFVVVCLIFFGEPRYRIPIYPCLAILQAYGIVSLFSSLEHFKNNLAPRLRWVGGS